VECTITSRVEEFFTIIEIVVVVGFRGFTDEAWRCE
jgi:hypothetical protein